MKRILSAMLALCLIAALFLSFATPAEAASVGDAEKALQDAYYFNQSDSTITNWTTAILVRHSGINYVYTLHAPRSDMLTVVTKADDPNKVIVLSNGTLWKNNIYRYTAHESNGKEQGFYPAGVVTEGERISMVYWKDETTRAVIQGTAESFEDGMILVNIEGKADHPLLVLNSKNEVCALYYGSSYTAVPLFTDEDTFYGRSGSDATEPPTTNPPTTEPPTTEPPTTEPPTTEPPATEPPATNPPATEPPATNPPASEDSGDDGLAVEMPVELKDLDVMFEETVNQKTANKFGTVSLVVIAVLAAALAAAVVIIRRKKMQKIKDMLPEAEEGTTLDDGTVLDDGTELSEKPVVNSNLRLQFRNGKRIAPTRSFTIGRAPDNDIVLPNNSSASGHHCEIVVQNGTVCLRDLGSTNGTYVNGRRIAAGQLIQLTPGMVVYLGGPSSSEAFQVTLSGM